MREISIQSVEDGKVKYIEDGYLNKIVDSYYPWLADKHENVIKSRLDQWNRLFGAKNKKK